MSEILKVLNKKVELKSEVVELGLIDDFDKLFNAINNKDEKIGISLISALGKAENAYKKAIEEWSNVAKVGGKSTIAAKELGVDLPATFTNKIESAEAAIKDTQKILSKISSMYSAF